MSTNGPRSSSLYFHHASGFGLAGQINRPIQQTITTQAAVSLAPSGGHGTHRIENYRGPGGVSFGAAYVEVGGSLDTNNGNTHTTYSSSVIEDLNICNVVTADRVVARLTVYYPEPGSSSSGCANAKNVSTSGPNDPAPAPNQPAPAPSGSTLPPKPSFSIVGSHFDNLKIAGQAINVKLDYETFHDSTYSKFFDGLSGSAVPNRHVLMPSSVDLKKLSATDHNYGIVSDAANFYAQWHPINQPLMEGQHFWCSAANRRAWARPLTTDPKPPLTPPPPPPVDPPPVPKPGDPVDFGGVICVPRFGVIYLAEVVVYPNHRHLTMIRVRMCSPNDGYVDGPGTSGGGDGMPPRP